MKLEDFYNTEFVNYASYDNLRKIASVIDGQKNASRKVCCCILDKKIKDFVKVSQLGSKISEYTDYLHGSIDGVVVSLGQDFAGTNNVPLVKKRGNFGTRFSPEASASRYIFACGADALFKWFRPEDNAVLIDQYFEGSKIEPKFYVPTYPVILINGSEGVSSGFAQKILPRSFELIKRYQEMTLNGENTSEIEDEVFKPYFNGFTGEILKTEQENQWEIRGSIKRIKKNQIQVTEIPVGYSLKSYLAVLNKLEDEKKILHYSDNSDDDLFNFTVTFPSKALDNMSDLDILRHLKLVKLITENYTCLNEHNKITVFNSPKEIFDYFLKFKLEFMQRRKDSLLEAYKKESDILAAKSKFIELVQLGEIIINNKKHADVIEQLNGYQDLPAVDDYGYLLKMPIYTLTTERAKQLKTQAKDKLRQIKALAKKPVQELILGDMIY